MELIERIKREIFQGNFEKARECVKQLDADRIGLELLDLAHESENVAVYFFMLDWLFDEESAEMQQMTSTILSMGLTWMPGAYKLAMNHIRRAIQLDPNKIEYKMSMLSFYEIPERLLSLEEAKVFAKQILEFYPDNKRAQRIFEKKSSI